MKKISILLVSMFTMILLPMSVSASTPNISIPIKTIIRGAVNSSHDLKSVKVADEDANATCSVVATAKNQGSVHPGNDLVVSSGDTSVTLKNVEREANGLTTANGQLVLEDSVDVTLILGQDKVFSGGMDVELTCEKPPVIIEVCRDGSVIAINEDEKLESDTKAPCPTPETPLIKVCRDEKVITIKEDAKLESDTEAPCPVVLAEVTTLPKTGSGSMIGIIVATGILSAFIHAVLTRKRI